MSKHTPLVLIHFILMVPWSYPSSWSFSFVSLTMSLASYFSRLMTNDRNNMRELYCYRTKRYVSFFIARMIIFVFYLLQLHLVPHTLHYILVSFIYPFAIPQSQKNPSMNCHLFWAHSSDLSNTIGSEPCFTSAKDLLFASQHFFFLFSLWKASVKIPPFHRSWTDLTSEELCQVLSDAMTVFLSHSHYQKSQPLSCSVENILSPSTVCSHVWIWICAFSYSV